MCDVNSKCTRGNTQIWLALSIVSSDLFIDCVVPHSTGTVRKPLVFCPQIGHYCRAVLVTEFAISFFGKKVNLPTDSRSGNYQSAS
jgi:hypothetical protein